MTTKTTKFLLFDVVFAGVLTCVQIVILRVALGSPPPLWACAVVGGVTGVAWAIGSAVAASAVRRARDE